MTMIDNAMYESVLDNAKIGVIFCNADGAISRVSQAACDLFEYTAQEFCQLNFSAFIDHESENALPQIRHAAYNSQIKLVVRCFKKNGQIIDAEFSSSVINGQANGDILCCVINDITEKIAAERKLELLINNTEESFLLLDKNLRIISFSACFKKLYELYMNTSLEEGKNIIDYVRQDRKTAVQGVYLRVLGGHDDETITSFPGSDGQERSFYIKYRPVKNLAGHVSGIYVGASDITEQILSQATTKESDQRYRKLFFDNPVPMWIADAVSERFLEVNEQAIATYGYSREDFLTMNVCGIKALSERVTRKNAAGGENDANIFHNGKCCHQKKNGELMYADITTHHIDYQGNKAQLVLALDITEKIKSEELKDFEKRDKEALINCTSDLMWSVSSDFKLIAANKAFTERMEVLTSKHFLSGDNLIDECVFDQHHLDFWKNLYLRAFAGDHCKQEIFYPALDGSSDQWNEISFNPIFKDEKLVGLACYSRNITEQKKAELFIRNSEEKRRLIMNAALDAIICINIYGKITFWNPQACLIFGWSEREAIGQSLSALIIPERFRKYHDAGMENYLRTGKGAALNVLLELEAKNRNGAIFPIELTVLPIKQGNEEFFCAFIRDISQRKKAEEAIVMSNERYNIVAKTTNDSIWDWDLCTNEVFRPGKKLENLLGYEAVEPDGVDAFWQTHVHPDDWHNMGQKRNLLFQDPDEVYWDDEYRFLKPDGKYAYVADKGYILRDKEGRATRMIGASRDITSEKERINEIIRIQQNIDSLINTTNDLIWSIDTECRIITANKAYSDSIENVTGLPVKEGDSVLLSEVSMTQREKWTGWYARALNGEQFSIEESLFNGTSQAWWYSIVSFSPIVNEGHCITGVACFAKDVTELKKSAEKLEELNQQLIIKADELAISNRELEQFAYVASHDLQEPLRMITGFLTQLEKKYAPFIDDKGKKYIDFAVDGARRMRQIILDLLEFSRAGRMEDKREEVNLNSLVDEICILFRTKIEKNAAVIRVPNLPVIRSSKTALRQVFQNLIGNALKYHNPQQLPEIRIEVIETSAWWEFIVTDNGIGINGEYFDKIFVLFQRLHSKDEYPGTGMGLALTKKIVENAGGKIWVESEEGKGSMFHFTVTK